MNIETIRPDKIKKDVEDRKTDIDLVKRLINDLVLYNDIKKDLSNVDESWNRELDLLSDLEKGAKGLLEKAVMVSINHQAVRVAIVGNFSAGKSTFINSLIQENICPEDDRPTTSSVTTFSFAHNLAFFVAEKEGAKREISPADYEKMIQHGTDKTVGGNACFYVEGPWNFVRDISLIDTPGFQKGSDAFIEGGDDELTEKVIKKEADVLFWLMDVGDKGTIPKDQKERIERLKKETNNMVDIYFVLNKADYKGAIGRQKAVDDIKKDIGHLIKDIFLYSSKSNNKTLENFQDIIKKITESVNNQSTNQVEKWELKLSSSIGGRGGLKFHYHDNGSEINFSHKFENGKEIGRISNRLEVQEMLKEIGTRKKELFNKHFEKEAASYKKRKRKLNYFKSKVQKEIDNINHNFEKQNKLFSKELEAISSFFTEYNISTFSHMNIDNEKDEIVNAFICLYLNYYNIFRKKVADKFQFKIMDSELSNFEIGYVLDVNLYVFKKIKFSIQSTTNQFRNRLYAIFYEFNKNKYNLLKTKYTNITNNLTNFL